MLEKGMFSHIGRQGIREKSESFKIRMPLVLEGQIRSGQPNVHWIRVNNMMNVHLVPHCINL